MWKKQQKTIQTQAKLEFSSLVLKEGPVTEYQYPALLVRAF